MKNDIVKLYCVKVSGSVVNFLLPVDKSKMRIHSQWLSYNYLLNYEKMDTFNSLSKSLNIYEILVGSTLFNTLNNQK